MSNRAPAARTRPGHGPGKFSGSLENQRLTAKNRLAAGAPALPRRDNRVVGEAQRHLLDQLTGTPANGTHTLPLVPSGLGTLTPFTGTECLSSSATIVAERGARALLTGR